MIKALLICLSSIILGSIGYIIISWIIDKVKIKKHIQAISGSEVKA